MFKYFLAAAALLSRSVLSQRTPGGIITSSVDPSSFGNVDVIYTTNLALNVTVNFDTKKMYGYVDLTMKAK